MTYQLVKMGQLADGTDLYALQSSEPIPEQHHAAPNGNGNGNGRGRGNWLRTEEYKAKMRRAQLRYWRRKRQTADAPEVPQPEAV